MVCARGPGGRDHGLVPGLGILLDSLLLKLGYFNLPDTHPAYYVIYGAAQVVLGLYLMRGAPFLVDFVYPREKRTKLDLRKNRPEVIPAA